MACCVLNLPGTTDSYLPVAVYIPHLNNNYRDLPLSDNLSNLTFINKIKSNNCTDVQVQTTELPIL